MTVVALIPAPGSGDRLGVHVPDVFMPVGSAPLLLHAVRRLCEAGVDQVVVAVGSADLDAAASLLGGLARVVVGGVDRVASVRAALAHADPAAQVILVHEAARALVPVSVIHAVIYAVRAGNAAVVPVLPVTDTIRAVGPDGAAVRVVDRAGLRMVQTPQGFDPAVLRAAYRQVAVGDPTEIDDAGLVERLGVIVSVVPGHRAAFRISAPTNLR